VCSCSVGPLCARFCSIGPLRVVSNWVVPFIYVSSCCTRFDIFLYSYLHPDFTRMIKIFSSDLYIWRSSFCFIFNQTCCVVLGSVSLCVSVFCGSLCVCPCPVGSLCV